MGTTSNDIPDLAAFGVKGLDTILLGGLPRNCIYLVEGSPGTGKTTLSLQFLLEGARLGEKGLYITLSETKNELLAVANSHGWSLDDINIYDLALPEESLHDDAQYTLYHPSEIELGETTKAVFERIERVQPRRVIFDSLSEMRLLARDPLRYRRQVLALKQFFVNRQCTVLLINDHNSEESDRQIESLAHGVLSLQHISPEYGGPHRRLRMLKLRGVNYMGGYHDFNIDTGGIVVFPRMVAANQHTEFARETLSSGIKRLDDLSGGGLDAGTSTLILGPAGTGKSTIATQYIAAAAERGQHGAVFIFDETVSTFLTRSAGLGIDLERHIKEGRCSLRQVNPAELSPGEFSHLVRQQVEENKAKLIVIDSLNGYHHAMPEEHFLTAHMHELLSYLGQQGVMTIVVVSQHGLFGTHMSPPVDLSYLADTVLLLRYFEARSRVLKAISVVKKRTGSHADSICELRITSNGIEVGAELIGFQGVLTGLPQYTGKESELMGAGDDKPEG